jgi:Tol biopolymer transport system component
MRQQVYLWTFIGFVAFLMVASCKPSANPTSSSALKLKRIAIPARVFTIAGEALAFEAGGDANLKGAASVSLQKLRARFGNFERVFVYEYDKQGKVLSQQELQLDATDTIAFKASSGNRYLLFPDLGARFRDTYVVVCKLGNARLQGSVVPRICTQILCTDAPFQASQLRERIPELKSETGLADVGDGFIGGFGRTGNICDQCLGSPEPGGRDFVPASGCADTVPPDSATPANPEVIVYSHWDYQTNPDSHFQIYRTKSDGSDVVNLSNNENWERSPDVNQNSRRIVFESGGQHSGLFIMDLNGANRVAVPDTVFASHPKWSRNAESFIVYTNLEANVNNSLHRVSPDGTGNVEIVHADKNKVIRTADVVDDFHVIYTQDDGSGRDSDIFIKDMRDDGPPVNLTNTADIAEEFPVVSHDGSLIAFRAHNPNDFQGYEIRIVRLTLPSTLTPVRTIQWGAPAGVIFRDPEFSNDDTRVYVAADTGTETTDGTLQLFSVNMDGTVYFRITLDDETDLEPSVAPR